MLARRAPRGVQHGSGSEARRGVGSGRRAAFGAHPARRARAALEPVPRAAHLDAGERVAPRRVPSAAIGTASFAGPPKPHAAIVTMRSLTLSPSGSTRAARHPGAAGRGQPSDARARRANCSALSQLRSHRSPARPTPLSSPSLAPSSRWELVTGAARTVTMALGCATSARPFFTVRVLSQISDPLFELTHRALRVQEGARDRHQRRLRRGPSRSGDAARSEALAEFRGPR